MKKFILLLPLVLLSSCNQQNSTTPGSDNYRFGQKQYENKSVSVEIVTYNSRAKLKRESRKYGVTSDTVVAFTLLSKNDQTKCTIHMMDPYNAYEPEFVGHEFLHCVYGQWHTNNESRK